MSFIHGAPIAVQMMMLTTDIRNPTRNHSLVLM
ncbi:Uncharacterised protein [Mycobacteroides abscessus subsp. abscessus]|nr:Uncharacterised protein [Mycobacteroides abscessus subsp. abscessus]